MTTDEQLRDAFERRINGAKQAQLRWVTVDTVDKAGRTMDVTGVVDQLEYVSTRNRERFVWSGSLRDRRLTPS